MNPLVATLLVGAGGALGAAARFWASAGLGGVLGTGLPIATFCINVAGSFLIGVLATKLEGNAPALLFLTVGVLGGFTTFSAFAIEAVRLAASDRLVEATLYAVGSCVFSIAAAAAGIAVARA